MEAVDFLRQKSDISRAISLDDESLNMAFRMIAENMDDILMFDGIDMAKMAKKGKAFG